VAVLSKIDLGSLSHHTGYMTSGRMTNGAFGDAIGVTNSYASYMRNGHRKPSAELLIKIILTFELEPVPAMRAYQEGTEAFGVFLRETVFDVALPGDTDQEPAIPAA
jgi:hypothetical protein